jgi:hypothetical protein
MTKQRIKRTGRSGAAPPDPAHAPGKRGLGPPQETAHMPPPAQVERTRHQPWVPTSGLIGRTRRSARRG